MPRFIGEVGIGTAADPAVDLQEMGTTNHQIYGIGSATNSAANPRVRLYQLTVENRPRSAVLGPLATTIQWGLYFAATSAPGTDSNYPYSRLSGEQSARLTMRIEHTGGTTEDRSVFTPMGKAELPAIPGASHTIEFWDDPLLVWTPSGSSPNFGVWNLGGNAASRFTVHAVFAP